MVRWQQLMFKQEVQMQLLPKWIYYHYHISWLLQVEDCDYKWCMHRQMVCNDNIFVFNANCVDTFRWAIRLFKRPF